MMLILHKCFTQGDQNEELDIPQVCLRGVDRTRVEGLQLGSKLRAVEFHCVDEEDCVVEGWHMEFVRLGRGGRGGPGKTVCLSFEEEVGDRKGRVVRVRMHQIQDTAVEGPIR
jgi:hypothetical protein